MDNNEIKILPTKKGKFILKKGETEVLCPSGFKEILQHSNFNHLEGKLEVEIEVCVFDNEEEAEIELKKQIS